jgi:hypothetical protein
MLRKLLVVGFTLASAVSGALASDAAAVRAKLTPAQIVEKNVAARGGLQAWRAVQTMSFAGKMGAGGNQRGTLPNPMPTEKSGKVPMPSRLAEEAQLPFTMEMQRPRKVRIELQFKGQAAVQVYDGTNGWKLRPYLNRLEVEPFTADEQKAASMQTEIDGPLVDYAAKGTQIELTGVDQVDGRDNYNLKLAMKNGHVVHVWIDAQTFLETKIEGQPRRLDGKMHPVEIYYRDYREVNGLQVPYLLETKVLPIEDPARHVKELPIPVEKITIDKVVVNPKLDASRFSKPQVEVAMTRP